jgi:hypothetical protein
LLDHAQPLPVAARVVTAAAGVDGGDRVAHRAGEEAVLDLDQRRRQRLDLGARRTQQVVGEAGRRLRADRRQAGELSDQAGERIGGVVDRRVLGRCGGRSRR